MTPKELLSCKVKKPSVPNIINCPICGMSQVVDDAGAPYYPHRHDKLGNPTLVFDQRGNYICLHNDIGAQTALSYRGPVSSWLKRWKH